MRTQQLDNAMIILQLCYNKIYFWAIILTYFLIRLRLHHETFSKKLKNHLFWQTINPLWRSLSIAEILSENRSPIPPVPIYAFLTTQQPIFNLRGDAGSHLSHYTGIGANRNNPPLKIQSGCRFMPLRLKKTLLSNGAHGRMCG